jgi:hypothetical protein
VSAGILDRTVCVVHIPKVVVNDGILYELSRTLQLDDGLLEPPLPEVGSPKAVDEEPVPGIKFPCLLYHLDRLGQINAPLGIRVADVIACSADTGIELYHTPGGIDRIIHSSHPVQEHPQVVPDVCLIGTRVDRRLNSRILAPQTVQAGRLAARP